MRALLRFSRGSRAVVLVVSLTTLAVVGGRAIGFVTRARQGEPRPQAEVLLPSEVGDPVVAAVASMATRPLEGRLSGQMRYAPFSETDRLEPARLLGPLVDRDLARDVSRPETRIRQAKIALLSGRTDHAIETLRDCLLLEHSDASLWNDVAVAYLARPPDKEEPAPLIRALGAVERALSLDADHVEARFNRALILGRLGIGGQPERAAWQAAVERLPAGNGWRREIEERAIVEDDPREVWQRVTGAAMVELTVTPELAGLVPRHPTAVRQWLGEALLPAWAQTWQTGDRLRAGRLLALATDVARIEARFDPADAEAVETIGAAGGQSGELVAGHALYGAAVEAYGRYELRQAEDLFREARDRFEVAGSPFRHWSEFQIAVCEYLRFDRRTTVQRLSDLLLVVKGKGYLGLEGRAFYVLGLTHHIEGRPAEAIENLERSLASFESIGDREGAAPVHALLAEAEQTIGRSDRMWLHHLESLKGIPYVRESRRRNLIFCEAAIAAADLGEPEAGRAIARWRLAEVDEGTAAAERAVLFRTLALVELAAQRPREALQYLKREGSVLQGAETGHVVRGLWGDYRALEGWLLREKDPDAAIHALSEAIDSYRDTNFRQRFAQLLHQRAMLRLARGESRAAESDLLAAAGAREAERQEIDCVSPVWPLRQDSHDLPGSRTPADGSREVGRGSRDRRAGKGPGVDRSTDSRRGLLAETRCHSGRRGGHPSRSCHWNDTPHLPGDRRVDPSVEGRSSPRPRGNPGRRFCGVASAELSRPEEARFGEPGAAPVGFTGTFCRMSSAADRVTRWASMGRTVRGRCRGTLS